MYINFRQGIVTYPISGALQNFLVSSGSYVTLYAANGRTDVAFAQGNEDYLLSETQTVQDAWGPLPASTDCWLYWDIDKRTAARTFGFTTVAPVYGDTQPTSPVADQHWFDTHNEIMYVYSSGMFREVIRVFAAKFNNSVFTPVQYGTMQRPYSGSQVGLNGIPVFAGRILIDDLGNPVRRSNGHFFTTEHDFFVDGSPVNILRLESTTLTGTAQYENLAAYQVVVFSAFGEISHATYNDIQTKAVAMLLESVNRYDTGTVCLQGHVTNPAWNWTTVGAPLWIDDTGALIEYDPHVATPLAYPVGKSPVARVITRHSVMFDQGLGGKGDTGSGSEIILATGATAGVTKLSLAAADPTNPIAVGTNDPRMTDARAPLAHTQAATTVIPVAYGSLTGSNLQLVLQQIEDNKVAISGSTMTGPLILSGAPTTSLQAATKAYVDAIDLSSRVAKAGDTMTGYLTLVGTPVNANHAATKQYVDAVAQGLSIKPSVKAATTVDLGATYQNGTAGVGATLTIPPMATLDVDGVTAWSLTDGILVKNQTNLATNGRYYISQVGNALLEWILTRCSYCDQANEIPGSYVFVQGGNTQVGTGWSAFVDTNLGADPNVFEVGFDNIHWTQFSGQGTYTAGPGLLLSGNQFSLDTLSIPYDIAFYVAANPFLPSSIVGGFLSPRLVYLDTTSPSVAIATCTTPPSSAAGAVFDLYISSIFAATVTFPQNSTIGTVTWNATSYYIHPSDQVTLMTTATLDPAVAGIGITITGCSQAVSCVYVPPVLA